MPPALLQRARRGKARTSRASAYALDVLEGRILAGQYVRLACRRHLDLVERVEAGTSPDLRWADQDAADAIAFYGQLRHVKGRWAGETFQLLDWQAFVVGSLFGWQRYDAALREWVRLYREAYISVARKQGKTTLAAGLGLWLLDYDREPGAEVYFAASKRDQARQCFDAAVGFVQGAPYLQRRIRYHPSVNKLIVLQTASILMPLGRDSQSEHGLNPSGAVIDELHVHRTRDMVDALDTAMGSRSQPLLIYITTAGVEGASIYIETDDRARRVLTGHTIDPTLFSYIATLDEEDDWRDPWNYVKANPSLGVTVQLEELEAEMRKAIAIPGRQAPFRRLRLNQRTRAEGVWLNLADWDACVAPELARRGKRLIGVDLGGRQDLSAAAAVTVDADGIDVDIRLWMPADLVDLSEERDGVPYRAWAAEGWISLTPGDYRDDRVIADDLSRWHGGAIEYDLDTWNSTTLTPLLQERGYVVVLVPQTFRQLTAAVAAFEDAVVRRRLRHLGNPALRWMLANTSLEESSDGGRKPIKADRLRNRRRIDGVSAILDALSRLSEAELPLPPATWGFGAV